MADLTYKDVQQACQEAVRNIEANVQRLTNDMKTLSNQMQSLDQVSRDILVIRQNLQQNLGTRTDAISFNSAPNMNTVEDKITSIKNDVQDLKNQS